MVLGEYKTPEHLFMTERLLNLDYSLALRKNAFSHTGSLVYTLLTLVWYGNFVT